MLETPQASLTMNRNQLKQFQMNFFYFNQQSSTSPSATKGTRTGGQPSFRRPVAAAPGACPRTNMAFSPPTKASSRTRSAFPWTCRGCWPTGTNGWRWSRTFRLAAHARWKRCKCDGCHDNFDALVEGRTCKVGMFLFFHAFMTCITL